MAAHGYLVHLIRAGYNRRPEQLYRLNATGQSEEDLLDLLTYHVRGLGPGYHAVDKNAEGFRIKECAVRGRTLWVKINRGPAGAPGETYDLDTDQSIDTTERQAQLSGLRALFVVPKDSYFGLLFVERVGRRNLKDLLHDIAIRPTASSAGAVLRLEAFAEIKDWERELALYQVLRVSESLVKRDSGEDASTAEDTLIKVTAEGGRLHRLGDGLKNAFTARVRRRDDRLDAMSDVSRLAERRREAEADGVAFQDEEEYQAMVQLVRDLNVAESREHDEELIDLVDDVLEIDREDLEHQRFEVSLGNERPQRNIVVEANSIPQFVYELGGRLTDGALRNAWVDHAGSILKARGVDLPPGWAEGRKRSASDWGRFSVTTSQLGP
jgi:hypothetical protein